MTTNEYMELQKRNVRDEFKDVPTEEIRETLKKTAFPYAVAVEHWKGDFNLSTVLRNANAFNALEVFYVGGKKDWDRRGSVGTHHYTDITFVPTLEEFKKLAETYTIIGIDCIPGSVSINNVNWQPNTLLVFGEEGTGLTPEMVAICSKIVHINQYGSVRSLNAGCASAIAMFSITNHFAEMEMI